MTIGALELSWISWISWQLRCFKSPVPLINWGIFLLLGTPFTSRSNITGHQKIRLPGVTKLRVFGVHPSRGSRASSLANPVSLVKPSQRRAMLFSVLPRVPKDHPGSTGLPILKLLLNHPASKLWWLMNLGSPKSFTVASYYAWLSFFVGESSI